MLLKEKPCIVFDIESVLNIFTCTCKNTETGQIQTFEISHRKNQLQELCDFFLTENAYFVGYNNIHYDNPMINYCISIRYNKHSKIPGALTASLNNLSNIIIHGDEKLWLRYKYEKNFNTVDLLTMLYSKQLRVSLKAMQITMHYKNVKEFIHDWTKPLEKDKFDELIEYNINDVESTAALLNYCKKDLDLRLEIEKEYNIQCLSDDGVNIGMKILAKHYMEKTGISWEELKTLRSPCDVVDLEKVILPIVKFESPLLQTILTDMKNQHSVSPGKGGYENTFLFGGMKIKIGVGGIHGDSGTDIISTSEDEILIDEDVSSLYPSMIISHNFYPPHLGIEFIDVYSTIRSERFEAKRNGNKIKNETLKLALNGLSGNLQQEFSWVYSPFTVMQVRINGQLLLLMLAERLLNVGCSLKQINTDGILFSVPKSKIDIYKQICRDWEKETSVTLESETFTKFYQRDINNYFAICENGDIKKKGFFHTNTYLGKGLSPKIIPEAIINYFIHNKPVKQTIEECKDIRKFLQSEKTDKKWEVEYNDIKQQLINRFYVSNSGYYLYKWKWNEKKTEKLYTNMLKGYGVKLLNEFPIEDKHFNELYDINYAYYCLQANKIIEQLNTKQLELFSFT